MRTALLPRSRKAAIIMSAVPPHALGTGLEEVSRVVAAAFQAAAGAREDQRRRREQGALLTLVEDTVALLRPLWTGPV